MVVAVHAVHHVGPFQAIEGFTLGIDAPQFTIEVIFGDAFPKARIKLAEALCFGRLGHANAVTSVTASVACRGDFRLSHHMVDSFVGYLIESMTRAY